MLPMANATRGASHPPQRYTPESRSRPEKSEGFVAVDSLSTQGVEMNRGGAGKYNYDETVMLFKASAAAARPSPWAAMICPIGRTTPSGNLGTKRSQTLKCRAQ